MSLDRFLSWPEDSSVLNVTVVGAGNLAHVFIGEWGARSDVSVSVLSRKAASIEEGVTKRGVSVSRQDSQRQKGEVIVGKADRISSNPADVVPEADVIILTVPSNARPASVAAIAPYISRDRAVFVGAMPGIGGFDWIARSTFKRHRLSNVVLFSIKDVPFMCTKVVPGESVVNLGPKTSLFLAVTASKESKESECAAKFLEELTKIPCDRLDTFMVSTLTPGNPIMHPAIMYGMFGPYSQWDGTPLAEPPLFYENANEMSAYFLTKADHEVQMIKLAVTRATGLDLTAVWPLRLNLKQVYGSLVEDNRTLYQALRTNVAYKHIRTPLRKLDGGFVPDMRHRFFVEDVPFGLVILRDIADMVGVSTPTIDELILWAQGLMGTQYLVNGRLEGRDMYTTGAPSQFGFSNIHDLVATRTDLPAKL